MRSRKCCSESAKRERWKTFRLCCKKVEEIPLRHERDELAVRRQPREVRHRDRVTVKNTANLSQLLVRQFEEFIEDPELVHQFERRWMNRVATKIAKEIGMLFQDRHLDPGAREQIAGHHSSRSASDDDAASPHDHKLRIKKEELRRQKLFALNVES